MENKMIWTFLVSASPLLMAGGIGLAMVTSYFVSAKLRNIRGILLFLLPGSLMSILALLGSSFVFWQGQMLIKNFESEIRSQLEHRQDEMINLMMTGRYIELGDILQSLKSSANLSEAAVYSNDSQLLAKAQDSMELSGLEVRTFELAKQDFDGTSVKWGVVKFRPGLKGMLDWIENARRRSLILTAVVVLVVLLFAIFSAWLIQRQMSGLFQALKRLQTKVKDAQTPGELADSLADQMPIGVQLMEEGGLNQSLAIIGKQISDLHKKTIELEVEARLGRTIAQVVHDIRSPLSLVKVVSESSSGISESNSKMLKMAYDRTSKITSDLLNKFKGQSESETSKIHLPFITLEQIGSEKRSIHAGKGAEIKLVCSREFRTAFAELDSKELGRALSNTIENAIEAVTTGVPKIEILCEIAQAGKAISIQIMDNGPGIPPDILAKLGRKGATFGKANGNGLGIFHSKELMASCGGNFEIKSSVGSGTVVEFVIPIVPAPVWFLSGLEIPNKKFLVLDDDPTIHAFWRRHFSDSILGVYTSPDQISDEQLENNAIGFLVDFDIRGAKINGLDFIEKYKLGGRAFLMTQEFDNNQVQQRAQMLGCQIIPKPLLEDVVISQEKPQKRDSYDAIVLDDDDLILMTWKMVADDLKKSVLCFSNGSDLKSNLKSIDPDCAFYIDSNLSKNEKGEDIAKNLFELGYKNLYLATGYEPDQFSHVTWVKAIVGKDVVL